jgi:propionyl-CoA synthetase
VALMMHVSVGSHAPNTYKDVYERSIRDPEEFWAEEASRVTWMKPWTRVLDNSNPPFTKWYSISINQSRVGI